MPFDVNDPEIKQAIADAAKAAEDRVKAETAATLATLAKERDALKAAADTAAADLAAARKDLEAAKAGGTATASEIEALRLKVKAHEDAQKAEAEKAQAALLARMQKLPPGVRLPPALLAQLPPDEADQWLAAQETAHKIPAGRAGGGTAADEPTEEDRKWADANGYGNAKPATIIRASSAFGPRADAKRRAAS